MTVSSTWTAPTAGGTLDLATSAIVGESHWDAMVSNFLYLGGATGAMSTFTPTLADGTGFLSITGASGRYWQFGKLVCFTVDMTLAAGGTSGQITVGALPVAHSGNNGMVGTGVYFDTSAFVYHTCTGYWSTTTSFWLTSAKETNGYLGQSVVAGTGDVFRFGGVYEVA